LFNVSIPSCGAGHRGGRRYLTTDQVAERYLGGCHPGSVLRLAKQKKLRPPIRLSPGGPWLWNEALLDEDFDALQREADARYASEAPAA
jgi:hypothetical protein